MLSGAPCRLSQMLAPGWSPRFPVPCDLRATEAHLGEAVSSVVGMSKGGVEVVE